MRRLVTKLFALTLLLMLTSWTAAFGQITSTATGGLWSATSTWVGGVLPAAANDVVIADGATVTIDAAAITVASLTVGQGTSGMLLFDRTTGRALTVTGNVTVKTGASFLSTDFTALTPTGDLTNGNLTITNVSSTTGIVAGMLVAGNNYNMSGATVASVTSNTIVLAGGAPTVAGTSVPLTIQLPAITQTLTIGGNLTNNGTFDMSKATSTANASTTACNVTFNNTTGDQTISGSSTALTRFQGVTLLKSVVTNKVISNIDTYIGPGFTLTAGTWNQHAGNLINGNGTKTLGSATGKLLIDGTAGYTNYAGSSYQFPQYTSGSLAVTVGTLEVNTTGNVQIGVGNNSITTGGTIDLKAGTIKIYGRLTIITGTTTIEGANISIDPNPSASSGTYMSTALLTSASPLGATSNTFEVSGTPNFTFSSGSVTIVNPIAAAGTGRDLKLTATGTGLNITGGTIYVGDGTSTKTSSTYPGFVSGSSSTIANTLVVQTGTTAGRNFSISLGNLAVSGTLTVAANGVLDCGAKQIIGAGILNLNAGGTIKTSLAAGINGIFANTTTPWTGTTNLSTGANYEFDGPTATAVTGTSMPATVNNLIVTNATGVTLSQATTATGATTVNAGALLKTGAFTFTNNGTATINGSFQIDEGGWATGTDFVYGPASTLVFNNTSGSYGVASDAKYWPYTGGPNSVTVGTGGITLNAWRTVNGLIQTAFGVTIPSGQKLIVNGQLQINSGGYIGGISPEYGAASSLVYNIGAGGYNSSLEWPSTLAPFNVVLQNATPVTLSASRSIAGALTLTSGKLSLGANNLTVASISGASATNYVVTDGAGVLTQPIAAAATVVFPIGASAASYDPVSVKPVLATNFSAKVNPFTGIPASGYNYNAKVWNLNSDAPSSTALILTPSAVTATGANALIAYFDGTNYVNVPAALASGAYSASFSSFPLVAVTGATDLPTGISLAKLNGVRFDGQTIYNNANQDLQVYDITGRQVVSSNHNINMNSNPNGIYIVKSNTGILKITLNK